MKRLLCGAVGAGLAAVGVGALVAPRPSAWMFGLATDEPAALAFVRAAGARDLILGLIIAASLDQPQTLRRVVGCTSLVGLADGILLAALRGAHRSLVFHLGGFAAVAALALALGDE
ncbi:MAG TPA: DUF4267 domain-containing protein [Candidatus Elarobacter sp.]|jgi:hypothetical protein